MANKTSITPVGLSLIKTFEGFRPQATELPNGIWVIGHGHVKTARKGARVSRRDAEDLLRWDLAQLEPKLRDLLFAPVSGPQLDALLSLAFNIGMDNFRKSDVVRFLNQGDPISAAAAFDVWKKAKFNEHVIVVDALVRRRAAEKARFLKVDAGSLSLPSARLQPLADGELATEIDAEAKARKETRDGDVYIDLGQSAALGGLMGQAARTEDGEIVTFGDGTPPEAEYHFSDTDDLEAEDVIGDKSPKVTPAKPAKTSESEGLVPLQDAMKGQDAEETETPEPETPENNLREVAEKISGRLDKVAVDIPKDAALATGAAMTAEKLVSGEAESEPPVEETPPVSDDKPPVEAELTPEAPEADTDASEPADQIEPETGVQPAAETDSIADDAGDAEAKSETETDAQTGDEAGNELPPLPEDGDQELDAERISRVAMEDTDRPFDALSRRNLGMFSLMGILGVIFTAGGIFELRRSGEVITYWDMVKGPGIAILGLFLILASVYYLMRRLGR